MRHENKKLFYSDTIHISYLIADEDDSRRRPKRHQSIKPQTLQITIDHLLEALLKYQSQTSKGKQYEQTKNQHYCRINRSFYRSFRLYNLHSTNSSQPQW